MSTKLFLSNTINKQLFTNWIPCSNKILNESSDVLLAKMSLGVLYKIPTLFITLRALRFKLSTPFTTIRILCIRTHIRKLTRLPRKRMYCLRWAVSKYHWWNRVTFFSLKTFTRAATDCHILKTRSRGPCINSFVRSISWAG